MHPRQLRDREARRRHAAAGLGPLSWAGLLNKFRGLVRRRCVIPERARTDRLAFGVDQDQPMLLSRDRNSHHIGAAATYLVYGFDYRRPPRSGVLF